LIGDEIVAPNDQAHQKNALKSLVTGETIQIEVKFQSLRNERNCANFVFLSNDNKPLALERDDRRHLVIYCPAKRTDGLYARVRASMDSGAIEAFFALLLERDLSNFHSHTPPVMTRAKADLVELGLRPAERFAREWLSQDMDLPLHPCSTGQLYKAFQKWARTTGERNPPNQAYFSTAVTKYARDRVSTKKASPSPLDAGTAITLWLPSGTGPMEGVRWYDFARDCVASFESPLARFCNGPREEPT
jgi:putative DNA primase/helicase